MPRRRDPALLNRLHVHLDNAKRLYAEPKDGRSEYDERPWRGNDTLILRAGWSSLETRYILRPPDDPKRVLKCWSFVFTDRLTHVELYDWLMSRK